MALLLKQKQKSQFSFKICTSKWFSRFFALILLHNLLSLSHRHYISYTIHQLDGHNECKYIFSLPKPCFLLDIFRFGSVIFPFYLCFMVKFQVFFLFHFSSFVYTFLCEWQFEMTMNEVTVNVKCDCQMPCMRYNTWHITTRVSVAHTKFELGFQIWIVWKGATINSYQKTVCSLHHMYHHFHLISSLIIDLWFSVIFCRKRQKSFNDLSYCPKLYCYLSE